jgi:hypothetical protein
MLTENCSWTSEDPFEDLSLTVIEGNHRVTALTELGQEQVWVSFFFQLSVVLLSIFYIKQVNIYSNIPSKILEVLSAECNFLHEHSIAKSTDFEVLERLHRYYFSETKRWEPLLGSINSPNYKQLSKLFPLLCSSATVRTPTEKSISKKFQPYFLLLKAVADKQRVWAYLKQQHEMFGSENLIKKNKLDFADFRALPEDSMLNILQGITRGDLTRKENVESAAWGEKYEGHVRACIEDLKKKEKRV